MSYRLYRFGTAALPDARIVGTFGTGASSEGVVRVVGGAHDVYGTTYTPLRIPYDIIYSCWIVHYDENAVQIKLKGWQAKRGVRAKLYRYNEYNGTEHWAYARLMQVRAPWQYQRKTMQPLELLFYVMTPWYEDSCAGSWVLDDGEVLDDGLFLDAACAVQKTLTTSTTDTTLTGGGNAPTNHVVVSITARTSTITAASVYIATGDVVCYISWAGTLLADKTLVIDARNQKIMNDGAPDTGTITINTAIHTSNYWLEIAPGSNDLTVTRSGGGATSTADFLYNYCWS